MFHKVYAVVLLFSLSRGIVKCIVTTFIAQFYDSRIFSSRNLINYIQTNKISKSLFASQTRVLKRANFKQIGIEHLIYYYTVCEIVHTVQKIYMPFNSIAHCIMNDFFLFESFKFLILFFVLATNTIYISKNNTFYEGT